MARLKNFYHDELERRRAYEDEMFDEEAISAAEDRAWAKATVATALAKDKVAAMRAEKSA